MAPGLPLLAWKPNKSGRPKAPPRPRKAPPAPEFAVHCAIADTLRRWLAPGWVWFHPANGGERPSILIGGRRVSFEGSRLGRMGVRRGASDFILAAPPGGRIHALELKRRGEQPTDEQLAFGAEVRLAGGVFAWADNYADAIARLKDWGALPRNVRPQ